MYQTLYLKLLIHLTGVHVLFRIQILTVFSILVLGFSSKSFAQTCTLEGPRTLEFFSSYERGLPKQNTSGLWYLDDNVSGEIDEPFKLSGCVGRSLRKTPFVMITLGVERPKLSNELVDTFYTGRIDGKSRCRLEVPASLKKINYGAATTEYIEKEINHDLNTIKKCLHFSIGEHGAKELSYPKEQPSCNIVNSDPRSARVNGLKCYFKPKYNSEFIFKYYVNQECVSREYLKANKIIPKDIKAKINVYSVSDMSDTPSILEPIEVIPLWLHLEPGKELLRKVGNVLDDKPHWNRFWSPNVNMGDFQLVQKLNNKVQFKTNILVNNICPSKSCKDGLCTSPCNFQIPVFPYIELYRLSKDRAGRAKWEYLDSWNSGSIIYPNWAGQMTSSVPHIVQGEEFKVGNQYELRVIFEDPKVAHTQFLNTFSSSGRLSFNNDFKGRPGLTKTPVVPKIEPHRALFGIPIIAKNEQQFGQKIEDNLTSLKRLLGSRYWPPFYRNYCPGGSKGKCMNAEKKLVVLSTKFTIKKFTKGSSNTKRIQLSNYRLTKRVARTYSGEVGADDYSAVQTQDMPKVNCLPVGQ